MGLQPLLKGPCSTNWAKTVNIDSSTRFFLQKNQTVYAKRKSNPRQRNGNPLFYHWTICVDILRITSKISRLHVNWLLYELLCEALGSCDHQVLFKEEPNLIPIPGVEPGPRLWKSPILTARPYRRATKLQEGFERTKQTLYEEWGSNPRGLRQQILSLSP